MGGGVCDLAGVCVRVFLFEILCGYEPERVLRGNQRIWFLAMETGKCGGKRRGGRVGLQTSDVALPERIGGSDGGFVRGDVLGAVAFYGFARACGGCVHYGIGGDGYVDAGEADSGALVGLGGGQSGFRCFVLLPGALSDLFFICLLWGFGRGGMDQLEKERSFVWRVNMVVW